MRSAFDGAVALRRALEDEGGSVAAALNRGAPDPGLRAQAGPAQVAATGPRARGREREYELLLEMILEGARLHYGTPTTVQAADRDLALLLGDQLYALGLARLVALGDIDAVAELADVISLVAQAQASGDEELSRAAWDGAAVAIGWGNTPEHARAKALARAGDTRAAGALRAGAAPEVRFGS